MEVMPPLHSMREMVSSAIVRFTFHSRWRTTLGRTRRVVLNATNLLRSETIFGHGYRAETQADRNVPGVMPSILTNSRVRWA